MHAARWTPVGCSDSRHGASGRAAPAPAAAASSGADGGRGFSPIPAATQEPGMRRETNRCRDGRITPTSRGMGNISPRRPAARLSPRRLGKHVVEVGTANGYSAMWFCLAAIHRRQAHDARSIQENCPGNRELQAGRSRATRDARRGETPIRRFQGPGRSTVVLLDAKKEALRLSGEAAAFVPLAKPDRCP